MKFLKEYEKATACFEKCYELNPDHLSVSFQLFLRAVQSKDYTNAFSYLKHCYNTDNEYYINDNNFYLYLLSMITKIPEQYREYVNNLKFENMIINSNDKQLKDDNSKDMIRSLALNKKFIVAYRKLNELINHNQSGKLTVQDIIVKTLLLQVIEAQKKSKMNIVKLSKEKKYDEIISCLEEEQEQHHLSFADECILFLARQISKFKETGIIPKKEIVSVNKLYETIKGNNFERALSLCIDYLKKNDIDPSDNAIFILLNEIIELIKTKTNKSSEHSAIISQRDVKVVTNPMTSNITFATVISYLMQQDLDNSFRALGEYLNSINKSQYEFLIIDLIKISLIEKDMAFSKPMIALTNVSRENFTFDVSEYIKNFYETLAQNRFKETRIYLNIIAQLNDLGQNCILTEGLEQVLNTIEKKFNYKYSDKKLDVLDDSVKGVEKNQ